MPSSKNWLGIAIVLLGMDLILLIALLSLLIMPSTPDFVNPVPSPFLSEPPQRAALPTPSPLPPNLDPPTSSPSPSAADSSQGLPLPVPSPSLPLPEPSPSPVPLSTPLSSPSPTPTPQKERKWIEVYLGQQRLVAYEDGKPVFEALVSTGTARYPTVTGRFRIYLKLLYSDMAGPGYYLRNVPYVMYFYRGYALHGTYWHNNFGRPMSHGCVNLRVEDARWLFYWTDPALPQGASFVYSSPDNPGTLVVIYR